MHYDITCLIITESRSLEDTWLLCKSEELATAATMRHHVVNADVAAAAAAATTHFRCP